jgi:hypothetical protein
LSAFFIYWFVTVREVKLEVLADVLLLVEEEAYLRTEVEEYLEAPCFLAKGEVGEEGYLQVVHIACVRVARTVVYLFVPSQLDVVELELCSADHVEILLGHIAGGEATGNAHLPVLLDTRGEAHRVVAHPRVDTDSEVMTCLADLCLQRHGARKEEEERYDAFYFHDAINRNPT